MHLALYLIIYCSLEIVSVEGWMSRKQRKKAVVCQIILTNHWQQVWNFEFKSLSLCTEGIRTEGQNLWNQHGGGLVTVWGCISARGLAISSEFMELRTEKWILIHHTIPSGKHQIGNIFFFHHNNVSKHAASAVQTYLDRKTYNWTLWGVDCPPQSPDLNITEAVVIPNIDFQDLFKPCFSLIYCLPVHVYMCSIILLHLCL